MMNNFFCIYGSVLLMDMLVDVGFCSFMFGVYFKLIIGIVIVGIFVFVVGIVFVLCDFVFGILLYYVVMFVLFVLIIGLMFFMKNLSLIGLVILYWVIVVIVGFGFGVYFVMV